MVGMSIWCVLFVTSQCDVIVMFPSNVLVKSVDIICICFYIHSPYFIALNINF